MQYGQQYEQAELVLLRTYVDLISLLRTRTLFTLYPPFTCVDLYQVQQYQIHEYSYASSLTNGEKQVGAKIKLERQNSGRHSSCISRTQPFHGLLEYVTTCHHAAVSSCAHVERSSKSSRSIYLTCTTHRELIQKQVT